MEQCSLEFKGRREGLFAIARGFEDFESFLQAIDSKLSMAGHFFTGACIAGVYGIYLDEEEETILSRTIEDKYPIKVRKPLIKGKGQDTRDCFEEAEEGFTRFVRSTLRSGQKISYDSNLVILGDVNPGAEVEAGGNIIVMGSLRGIARAGVPDNKNAFIAAIVFQPVQLWIGDVAARWPEKQEVSPWAEMAYVEDGRMYIKPFFTMR